MKTYLYPLFIILFLFVGCSKKESNPTNSPSDSPTGDNSTIDNVNAANGDISAAIDVNDKIHVAYFSFNAGLKYATNKTGSWVPVMIHPEDASITMSVFNDIAVDSSGFVYIVYTTSWLRISDTSTIYYVTNKTGTWVKTKITYSVGSDFSGVGIAVTSTGKAHIVYGSTSMDLWYTNNLSGVWSAHTRIGSYWANVRPRLALDANNNVYVAYEHGGEGTLRLQTINSSGGFLLNSILDGGNSGEDRGWTPDIAINKTNGTVLIPYWNYDSNHLKLYNNGTITKVDSVAWTEPSIVTDISGKAYISYTNPSTSELYLYSNRTGSWVKEKLSVSTPSSKYSSIVVESNGKIDIIYAGLTALKVATK